MVKVSKESLEAFQSVLETVDTSWQSEFNLRETVRQSFDLIKKAKQYKVSWERIADILKQTTGIHDGISPESIRQYYFEFSKNPELLPKKKRKPNPKKTTSENSTSVGSAVRIEKTAVVQTADQHSPATPVAASNTQAPPQPTSTPEAASATTPPSTSPVVSPSVAQSTPKKDDIRSQFNLSRRGK